MKENEKRHDYITMTFVSGTVCGGDRKDGKIYGYGKLTKNGEGIQREIRPGDE